MRKEGGVILAREAGAEWGGGVMVRGRRGEERGGEQRKKVRGVGRAVFEDSRVLIAGPP